MRLVLMWVLQAQFAGYVLARRELPELELIPWRPGTHAIDELLAGRAELGVVSPAQALARPDAAGRLVLVGLFMRESPIVLAALRGRRGERLEGLGGARVGVWPGEDLEVRAMLLASGVDLARLEFVPMGDDVTPLLRGDVDLLQATTYEEVPALIREGADQGQLVLHRPQAFGVDTAKDGLVVRRDVLQRDPAAVAAVVGAAVRGWRDALADPEAALAAVCAAAPALDRDWQRGQLARIAELVDAGERLGYPDPGEVERGARVHRLAGAQVDPTWLPVDPGPWEQAVRA